MHQKTETVVLASVKAALDAGRPDEAIDIIHRHGANSPEMQNAYGISLMRKRDATKALAVYRSLCLNASGFCLRQGLPAVFKMNYATALLLDGNVVGCLRILSEMELEQDPYVGRLRAAITRWQRSLKWWQRIAFACYGYGPPSPIPIDFEPGEFATPRALHPAA